MCCRISLNQNADVSSDMFPSLQEQEKDSPAKVQVSNGSPTISMPDTVIYVLHFVRIFHILVVFIT